ncbi:MAG TPA: hypothetical protein VNU96_12940 [Burkholderiales bacterium]|nr:hypothetical protein [Burkholderiales bacterium]
MQQLRRITDRVARTGQAATDQVAEQLAVMSKRGNKAAKSAYGYVMNHPKSATAVVLGTAMAAGLLWFMQRNGGYNEVRKQVLDRVRDTKSRAREHVATSPE